MSCGKIGILNAPIYRHTPWTNLDIGTGVVSADLAAVRLSGWNTMSPQIIEIVLFAAVAAFLLFRLRGVLGTRTGHEDPSESMRQRDFHRPHPGDERGVVIPVQTEETARDDSMEEAAPDLDGLDKDDPNRVPLTAMKRLEPTFTLDTFLDGAKQAYEMILLAFEHGDKKRLRSLLADEVFEDFALIIDERSRKKLVVDARFVGIRSAKIERIAFDKSARRAEIAVRFSAELITSVRDSKGKLVEGDPKSIRRQTDTWIFERIFGNQYPNWTLVET